MSDILPAGWSKSVMSRREFQRRSRAAATPAAAWTVLELLIVIGILGLLAGLLLPALSRAKAQGRNVACKSQLRQIGLALGMYASDSGHYPPINDWATRRLWMERLYPYAPLPWTNPSWHCPSYVANHGLTLMWATNTVTPWAGARWWTSYAYNHNGILGSGWTGWTGTPVLTLRGKLGLGGLPQLVAREPEVAAPSEMYAVADARSYRRTPSSGWFPIESTQAALGLYNMTAWRDAWFWDGSLQSLRELPPSHEPGYNVVFCDAHVESVKRRDYFFPPRTAHHWNRDNQPHEEAWAPRSEWAIQE